MNEIFKLMGTIGLSNSEANKGIDETTGKAESSAGKITGFFKNAAVAIGSAFAAKKLIDFGGLTVQAAAGAKAVQAQFEQVFVHAYGNADPRIKEGEINILVPFVFKCKDSLHERRGEDIPCFNLVFAVDTELLLEPRDFKPDELTPPAGNSLQ